ncbi:hypothetical protein H7A76_23140 [Pseudomonas sp. MSSRFD41]|uniref:hypothetical protein n=1 Tax=Pseudomonas sp. MSSRFD41 TaxID=1310370 RepID=UPI00163B32B5|nr:hypothetical protein [Pseudomonas sp. MSSRFD41]MBC2658347.1 hypothetical protein [Pseudomonas sp. MSSRFD41]
MSRSRVLKYLCWSFLLLSGCRMQTLYLNGEARGRVVDALSGLPIAGARGTLCGGEFLTAEDGSFQLDPAMDWEWVMLLAGRSPRDTPHPCPMRIAAADYQTRQWVAPFTANYDFPISLLPASSALRYALPAAQNPSMAASVLQAEPRPDEVFQSPGS